MSSSPIHRFTRELRRRRVPQTVAVYLVAAWAVIEFSDVVIPNLNGPQWIVTAVIVAALVGLPVVLVLSWAFEWSPEGLRRTSHGEDEAAEPSPEGPWLAAVAILVVAIGAAVGVAYVLHEPGDPEATADGGGEREQAERMAPESAPIPGFYGVTAAESLRAALQDSAGGLSDSVRLAVEGAMEALEGLTIPQLTGLGGQAGADLVEEVGILVATPGEWRGRATTPASLVEGDTLVVEGAAYDDAGIRAVLVDGDTAAVSVDTPTMLPYTAILRGTGRVGVRTVEIVAITGEGAEIHRGFEIIQLPADTP